MQLLQLYYQSVGRGASFLLNVPPDQRGLIDPADAASLRDFGVLLKQTFRVDRAAGAKVSASNVRAKNKTFRPENMIEGAGSRYWATDDGAENPEATFEWKHPETFNIIRLREFIPLGQRVEEFKIDIQKDRDWEPLAAGTTIGPCRIIRLPQKLTAMKVRLRITKTPAPPAISEFALYLEL